MRTTPIYLPKEIMETPITVLEISNRMKKALSRIGIYTFGELLNTDYERILTARNIGETYIKELKNYIHSLGYTLLNEQPFLSDILAEKRKRGVILLEDCGFSSKLCAVLYRGEIYSLDDLVNFGPDVYKLTNLGDVRKAELDAKMKEIGINFIEKPKHVDLQNPQQNGLSFVPTPEEIAKLQEENAIIEAQNAEKERLIAEYERLLQERVILQARERELDATIELKLKEMSAIEKGKVL